MGSSTNIYIYNDYRNDGHYRQRQRVGSNDHLYRFDNIYGPGASAAGRMVHTTNDPYYGSGGYEEPVYYPY